MSTVTADPSSKPRLSPRKRAQRMRWAQYAVLGIVTILAISMANWSQIQSVFFRGDMIHETLTQGLPNAFKNTIVYTLGAFVFGLVLGTMLALMRLSSVGPYRWIATTYIEFFRGLPAIVVFIAFGLLPLAFNGLVIPFDPYGTVWIALGLVGAAYMAETIRAGIQSHRTCRAWGSRPVVGSSRKSTRGSWTRARARSRRRVRSGCRPAPRHARSCSRRPSGSSPHR